MVGLISIVAPLVVALPLATCNPIGIQNNDIVLVARQDDGEIVPPTTTEGSAGPEPSRPSTPEPKPEPSRPSIPEGQEPPPVTPDDGSSGSVNEWDDDPSKDYCSHRLEDSEASRLAVWDVHGLGVGEYLWKWLDKNGQDDWVNRMAFDQLGETTNWECVGISGEDCGTLHDCSWYKEKKRARLYWVLRAVDTHYKVINALVSGFSRETLKNAINVPSIEETMKGKKPQAGVKPWDIVAAAAAMAGGISAASTPASAALGLMGGIIAMGQAFEEEKDEPDFTTNLADSLGGAFDSAIQGVQSQLRLAHSGKPPQDKGDAVKALTTGSLPQRSGTWPSDIAQYFDGGKWLLTDVATKVERTVNEWTKHVRQGMVISVLRERQFFVYIDAGQKESDCEKNGNGAYWIDDGRAWQCVDLWKMNKDVRGNPNGAEDTIAIADGGHNQEIDAMEKDPRFGSFDFRKMYRNAIDCARKYPDHPAKPADVLPAGGDVPECFYALPVVKGHRRWTQKGWDMWLERSDPIYTWYPGVEAS